MKERIAALIKNLKHLPGVYLMHDKDDKIIYIGKAKDLYKRVSQYFLRPQTGKVQKMAMEAEYFETIICASEKEAFVLEMNLIQTHYPKFNILLKDDSHYPYIALKKKGDPYLCIKRNNKDKNYDYFGPYPNATAAYNMIDLLNKIFPIRKCKNLAKETCLYYHMGQCLAPCVNKIDESVFLALREEIVAFMKGNNAKQRNEIKEKMLKASDNMEFETASEYKKVLDAIDHINTQQNVELRDKVDRDIFAYSEREGYLALVGLFYRKGILLGKKVFTVERFGELTEQVADLLLQFYSLSPLPSEVVINSKEVISLLDGLLDVSLVSVSKGKVHELVISANENATNALDEYFLTSKIDSNKIELIEELGKLINIPTPYHIELFDNSHIQGSSPVGAMVAYINGEPNKKLYRKFKIEHEESRDDLSSMKEIVFRHYSRLKESNSKMPDLILVDGGINQIKFATKALKEASVKIPVFGLVKNDKHQTSSLMDINENTYPIKNKNLFFLLTRMQDEVHRFAISFHREKRGKAMTSSLLDGVKGLGEKRKEMIYRAYVDINQLKQASLKELEQILPEDVALALYNKINFDIK